MLHPPEGFAGPRREAGDGLGPQGQRSLSSSTGKDLEKVVLIPTTTVASHRDALAIAVLLQQGQGEAIQPGHILPQPLLPDPRLVLAIRHVEDPMAAVLDAPVAPHRTRQLL